MTLKRSDYVPYWVLLIQCHTLHDTVSSSAWIWNASLNLLFHQLVSCSITLQHLIVLSHRMSWRVLLAWAAMPLLVLSVLTALLCSFILTYMQSPASLSNTPSPSQVSPLRQLRGCASIYPETFEGFNFCGRAICNDLVI